MERGSFFEVLRTFLRLGVTSFGGPVAHLGYFREELVVRRKWVDEETFADLVALCQFLPGPASSQLGMALGMERAGLPDEPAWTSTMKTPRDFMVALGAFLLLAVWHLPPWSVVLATAVLGGVVLC